MLPLQARVDLGAMAMKRYSAFPKAPALLEPHHQIVKCHIQDTCWRGVLPLCREAVGVSFSPSRLGNKTIKFPISTALFTQLNVKTVLFQTIQFSTFCLHSLRLFDP